MSEPRRVLIADDSPLVQFALAEIIKITSDLEIVGQVSLIEDAIAQASQQCPDIILLNRKLPDGSGIVACQKLLTHCPQTAIINIAATDADTPLACAWSAGAFGYLLSNIVVDEWIAALRQLGEGKKLWTVDQMNRIQTWRQAIGQQLDELTDRQWEVLHHIADGGDNESICQALAIQPKTLQNHIHALYAKLKVHSRAGLIVVYYKEHFENCYLLRLG